MRHAYNSDNSFPASQLPDRLVVNPIEMSAGKQQFGKRRRGLFLILYWATLLSAVNPVTTPETG